jgi:altronate dehydratase small subunit
MPRCMVLHPADNVATLIDAARAGDTCTLQGEREGVVTLLQDVAFGHKVCVAEVPRGGEILKYGQVIGRATQAITVGEHAHVHNIDSARARGDLAPGD